MTIHIGDVPPPVSEQTFSPVIFVLLVSMFGAGAEPALYPLRAWASKAHRRRVESNLILT